MSTKLLDIFFLNPFREAALPIGNRNIIRSLPSGFSFSIMKLPSYTADFNTKEIEIISVSSHAFLRSLQSIFFSFKKFFSSDVFIGNGGPREFLTMILAKIFRPSLKYIFCVHTCWERFGHNRKGPLFKRMQFWSYWYLLKRADAIITVSEFSKKGFAQGFHLDESKVHVIRDRTDIDLFQPSKKDLAWVKKFYGIKNNNKNVLYLSKITQTKRAYLIPKIAELLPEYNFIVHGKNELHLDFSKHTNIYFSDVRPPRECIPKIFASSDVFIFPSEVEPLAASVNEAMACGLPIVASKGGGTVEQVRQSVNGYLIDIKEGEIHEFVKKIKKILSDQKLHAAFSKKSREYAIELANSKQGERYIKLFRDVLNL